MLNFREELAKIKADKLRKMGIEQRVDCLLHTLVEHFESRVDDFVFQPVTVKVEKNNREKTLYVSLKEEPFLKKEKFSNPEDVTLMYKLLKEKFEHEEFELEVDGESSFWFEIIP